MVGFEGGMSKSVFLIHWILAIVLGLFVPQALISSPVDLWQSTQFVSCSRGLQEPALQSLSGTPIDHWMIGAQATRGTSIIGPTRIESSWNDSRPEDIENVYIHLLPGKAKALRGRFTQQEVNDLFLGLLVELNRSLSTSGFTVNHGSILNEYKSVRLVVSRGRMSEIHLERVIEQAIRRFEANLRIDNPTAHALLVNDNWTPEAWVSFGVGGSEYLSVITSNFAAPGRRDYALVREDVHRQWRRLHRLTNTIPLRLEAFAQLPLLTVSEGGQRRLAFEVFEILRKAEDREQLFKILESRRMAPSMTNEDRSDLFAIAADLWELRELLKKFTPANQWDAEDFSALDASKAELLRQADRALFIDIRSVGARIFREVHDKIAELPVFETTSAEELDQLIQSVNIKNSVSWLKSLLRETELSARSALGPRFVAISKAGDEFVIHYRGSQSVAPEMMSLTQAHAAFVRIMDVQVRTSHLGQDRVLPARGQSHLSLILENALKTIESKLLPQLEPNVSVSGQLNFVEGRLELNVEFRSSSDRDAGLINQWMQDQFAAFLELQWPAFRAWKDDVHLRWIFVTTSPSASSSR